MNGNTPVFAYVNNVQGYGLAEYWNGTAEWEIYENWDLFTYTALDLNSSGTHAALYDINVVQNGAVNWPDDKGGILTSFFYQPPDTTWNGTSYFYRDYNIWLDNLFKSGVSAILGRYQYPDIDMSRGSTTAFSTVFYSVYDSIDDRVLVRGLQRGHELGLRGQHEQDHRQRHQHRLHEHRAAEPGRHLARVHRHRDQQPAVRRRRHQRGHLAPERLHRRHGSGPLDRGGRHERQRRRRGLVRHRHERAEVRVQRRGRRRRQRHASPAP